MKSKKSKISEKISLKIKFERQKRGYSQDVLAFKAGLSKNHICLIETGKSSPTVNTLEKIAEALGMDFETFIDLSKIEL